MPQFDANHFPAEIFWTIIAFLLLFALLNRWVLPRIIKAIEHRTQIIREEIEAARRSREKAERLKQHYAQKLDSAEHEIRQMFEEADRRLRAEREQRMNEWRREMKRREAQFREELLVEKNRAAREIRAQAADLIVEATQRVLRHAVDRRELDHLARQALEELEGKPPGNKGPTIH